MDAATRSLAQRFRQSFSSQVVDRGEQYYRQHRVDSLEQEDDRISAVVLGSGSNSYLVEIDFALLQEQRSIAASCSCPHYADGNLCKHIWAALRGAEELLSEQVLPPRGNLHAIHEDEQLENDDELIDSSESFWLGDDAGAAGSIRGSSRQQSRNAKGWQEQFIRLGGWDEDISAGSNDRKRAAAKRQEVWYVLDVSASLEFGRLVIDLFHRETKRNGEFTKLKNLRVRWDTESQLSDPADRRLVGILTRSDEQGGLYGHGGGSWRSPSDARVQVSAHLHEWVLPELGATGRFVWLLDGSIPVEEATPLSWDEGSPWRFRLRVDEDSDNKCWTVSGQIFRGRQTKSLDEVVLLLKSGVVLLPDRIARLDAEEDFPWIVAFRRQPEVQVPFTDRDQWMDYLWSQPQLPKLKLPETLVAKRVRCSPRGRLQIKGPRGHKNARYLMTKLSFNYGEVTFANSDFAIGRYDSQHNHVIQRDRHKESQLVSQLETLDVRPVLSYGENSGFYQITRRALPGIVRQLVDWGWVVESEGLRVRKPGEFKIDVASNLDWFELNANVDFDGVPASLPRLLAAMKNSESYVRLDDGSLGMLPEQWLQRYGLIAGMGQADGESLKFHPSQALVLDSLLQDQKDVRVDASFRRLREKLQKFDGVRPRQQPRGLCGQLRPYQQDGLGWLHYLREFGFGGCLADDMGLGKTVQVLALLESRRTRRLGRDQVRHPSMVVVPKSLVFNWIEEAARFAPKMRVLNYTGLHRRQALAESAGFDLLVTTYGTLRRDIVDLKQLPLDYAILDEAQAIKNGSSQAAKAARLLNADHRLAMTGTPVENHLGELWSLFEFLNPGMLGRSAAFDAMFKTSDAQAEPSSLPTIRQAVKPFLLRRTKRQVLPDLPEKTEQTLVCEMSKQQRQDYNQLRDYYRDHLSKQIQSKGIKKSKIHVLEALLRLRQAACHPGLLDKNKIDESSAKLDTLLHQLQELVDEGHKALVFSQFTSFLSIIRKHIDRQKIVYEYLDGKTRKRAERVNRFQQDPECSLFLISLKAGGHGLNLTAADYVFILDPWWNPAVEAQAVDRAHRMGQQRHVSAYRLICRETVEDKILKLQQEKRQLAESIISEDQSLLRQLTAEDLQLLLS